MVQSIPNDHPLMIAARQIIQGADVMNPLSKAVDEAFLWEAPIEERALITFGDIKALRAAVEASDSCAAFRAARTPRRAIGWGES